MRIKIVKCDDSRDGRGRAMSGTIAEARNAVNIGNIDKFCNEAVGDFKLMGAGHDLFRGSLITAIKKRSFETFHGHRVKHSNNTMEGIMSRPIHNGLASKVLTPNISYQNRQVRILTGCALIVALMITAPTPLGLWGLAALVAIPLVGSGIIAWDPFHALFGINHYRESEGEIQQRSWSCPNIGKVDRIARLAVGVLLIATAFIGTEIVWQSITVLMAIPVIMSAILAWDPLYALAYTNTFATKSDVQSADPDLEEKTLAKFYRFPTVTPADKVKHAA
jgi:hypothetical protein